MLKAIIFDMDGVLVDSEPLHFEVDRLLLKEMGYELDYEYYKQFIGSTETVLWNSVKEKYQLKESTQVLKAMAGNKKREIVEEHGFPEIEGVYDMIKRLHDSGFTMAVASSSSAGYIEEVTSYFKIKQYFKYLVSGEDVKHPKPAPDIFLKSAQLLGVEPSECIVVEDSTIGTKAAKAAGMTCIGYVNPGSGPQNLESADYLIESYDCMDLEFVEMVYCRFACDIHEHER